MENKEKRTRLSMEKQKDLLGKFISEREETEFGVKELNDWFSKFEWYSKLPEKTKESRLIGFISVMKKMYGEKFRTISQGGGHPSVWKISDSEPTIEPKKKTKRPNERFERLYLLIRKAYNSKIGVSKKDAVRILNYETESISTQGLDSVNNRLEKTTGYRPFKMDKTHVFTRHDVITVDKEMASLIIEGYYKELGDLEVPVFESEYESEVKAVIRKDYQNLLMFKKSGMIKFRGGEAEKFRKSVIGIATISADKVAEKYQETLKKRYDIELEIIGTSRWGFEVTSKEDLKDALIRIENIFAEYFCEEIVPSERTEREKETKRELTPTDREKSMLGVIERDIFKGHDGNMFLSDLWSTFDTLGIKRHWDLLGLLKKYPEKFKISQKDHLGYTEVYVKYTAPTILPTTTPDIPEMVEPENEYPSQPEERKQTYKAYVGFCSRVDKPSELLIPKEKQKYKEDYIYEIEVNLEDKRAILEYLKLYWTSGDTIIAEDKRKTEEMMVQILTAK